MLEVFLFWNLISHYQSLPKFNKKIYGHSALFNKNVILQDETKKFLAIPLYLTKMLFYKKAE